MFTPLQKIIPHAAAALGIQREIEAALICEKYRKLAPVLVHADALRHTLPRFYRSRTLTIGVENSAWAHQVITHKKELIEALNKSLGKPLVQNLKTTLMESI